MFVGVVGGKQRCDIHVDREQVADGGVILGSIETMKRLAASRVRAGQRHRVDLALEPRGRRTIRGLIGPGVPSRRHRLCPQLDDHALPGLGLGAHVGQIPRVEGQPRHAGPVVVAPHTVLVEYLASGRCRHLTRRLRLLSDEALRPTEGSQHADQDDQPSDHRLWSHHLARRHFD